MNAAANAPSPAPPPPAPAPAPPVPQLLVAGSVIPGAGTLVTVPMSAASGDPGGAIVAVKVKDWFKSSTIWASVVGFAGAAADGIVNILVPILTSDQPVHWAAIWRPCAVVVLTTFVVWRRKTDNSVIGSGASAS